MEASLLAKFRQKVSGYEDSDNPIAPLSSAQSQFIIDVTHGEYERPIPSHLKRIPCKKKEPKNNLIEDSKLGSIFESRQQFNKWFADLEQQLANQADDEALLYVENLEECQQQVKDLLAHLGSALEELHILQQNYYFVSNKTNSLHTSCQQLIEEQVSLEEKSKEIDDNLTHFLQLERTASKLSSSSLLVTSDAFFAILEQIDSCLSFMVHNPGFKESAVYAAKYKHCLNRAISLIKTYVNRTFQETTNELNIAARNSSEPNIVFPLIYGNFSAGIAKLKRIFSEVENRRNSCQEYAEIFSEIQQSFFKEREKLLSLSVLSTVADLNTKGKMGTDLCSTFRSGCSFCINLCQDEFRLYGDFFQTSFTALFDEFMENLCTPLYDTLRPLIIKIQHLETLAELCSILRVEMLEEQTAVNALGLNSFIHIVEQLLQDTQERLVYRAHIYISTDIQNYKPGPGDLAYPEKLEMMEQIAESLDAQTEQRLLGRSNSQSSLISLSSATSQEVAAINNSISALQIPRPLKSSSSPADLHGMWFPSVRRTLLCLSKLYRCLDKAIFQGLSQEALIACISNVSASAQAIAARKTLVDGQLFEIKHLLILREQIAPFQVDFAVKEMSLDFSHVKVAALVLLQKKKQLFSLNSNNSLLEFIVDGTPQVKENFLDSKKEVDRQLKYTCELFISHCTQILIGPLNDFLRKATKVIEAQREKLELTLAQQSFALPEKLTQLVQDSVESLKSKLPFIHRSMRLYLANRETEFILFRPVKNNVLNGFLQMENIAIVHYSDVQLSCPTQEQINVLISSMMIQN